MVLHLEKVLYGGIAAALGDSQHEDHLPGTFQAKQKTKPRYMLVYIYEGTMKYHKPLGQLLIPQIAPQSPIKATGKLKDLRDHTLTNFCENIRPLECHL